MEIAKFVNSNPERFFFEGSHWSETEWWAELGTRSKSNLDNLFAALVNPYTPAYERFDVTLNYMYREMINNAQSEQVKHIQTMLQLAGCVNPLGPEAPPPGNYAVGALSAWTALVAPGMPWDHKPKLEEMLGLDSPPDYWFPIRGDTEYEYNYDICSNIHYGYVGSAAGFDAYTLQEGAKLVALVAGAHDVADELNVQIGIDLWQTYRFQLTPTHLRLAILNHRSDYYAKVTLAKREPIW